MRSVCAQGRTTYWLFDPCILIFVLYSRRGNCKRVSVGLPCEIGLRSRTYHVLAI